MRKVFLKERHGEIKTLDDLCRQTEIEWGEQHVAKDKPDLWLKIRWWLFPPPVLLVFIFAAYHAYFTPDPIFLSIANAAVSLIISVVPVIIVPIGVTVLSNHLEGEPRLLWLFSNVAVWTVYIYFVGLAIGGLFRFLL